MISPRLEWLLPEPVPDPPTFSGFGRPIATLLSRRGFGAQADLDHFLGAGVASLHDLALMTDAHAALDRLETALDAGEPIAIWGDYDADGMTSVAIWMLALRAAGATALHYVPSRIEEGYGLSRPGLEQLRAAGARLVVTCDCGIVNVEEVEVAREMGMDVVITDHHLPGRTLPRAVAVVDPHRPDCGYPDPEITGAGLSFRLATALLSRRGLDAPDLAALGAIGTIADVASMTGESRTIVRLGLEELARTSRPGLRALLARACEHPERPTARDVAFGIAPRINAAGRIAEAELAIGLLLEEDEDRAEALAEALERVHERRRELTRAAVDEASLLIAADGERTGPLALLGAWPAGIVGLVAGRLSESLARPVAVVTRLPDELRGSMRSPADFHAAAALEACAAHLTKRGGHAAAAGFSLLATDWEAFVQSFHALPRPFPAGSREPLLRAGSVEVDLVLPAAFIGWPLADEIDRLAPFGPGHREPMLAVTGLRVVDARRVGAGAEHVSIRLRRGVEVMDAIAFATPTDRPLPEPGERLDLVGTLERDMFGGIPRLRLRVVDYAHSEHSPLVARRRAVAIPVEPSPVAGGAG